MKFIILISLIFALCCFSVSGVRMPAGLEAPTQMVPSDYLQDMARLEAYLSFLKAQKQEEEVVVQTTTVESVGELPILRKPISRSEYIQNFAALLSQNDEVKVKDNRTQEELDTARSITFDQIKERRQQLRNRRLVK